MYLIEQKFNFKLGHPVDPGPPAQLESQARSSLHRCRSRQAPVKGERLYFSRSGFKCCTFRNAVFKMYQISFRNIIVHSNKILL